MTDDRSRVTVSPMSSPPATRFAPSPTGDLHLGHVYAALYARDAARRIGGTYLVRVEDIDATRARPDTIARQLEDLDWLGLGSEGPVWRQSDRLPVYAQALERLRERGVLYRCFCTRAEIRAEAEAAGQAPHGAGPVYSGRCRALDPARADALAAEGRAFAIRLNVAEAARRCGPLTWRDLQAGEQAATFDALGDFVVARKEIPTSYHLSVVVDDAAQGVAVVTRGRDLFDATHAHRLLQALLDLPVPVWDHHALVRDDDGERLAKRKGAKTLRDWRAEGLGPEQVLELAAIRAK